jgi:GntR family transcriptional repressor for pyruvate dehydrogenase complex
VKSGTRGASDVVEHVLKDMESGRLGQGNRLHAERELAVEMGVTRSSLRSGLRTLEALGVVTSRRGAGSHIVEGPPRQRRTPVRVLAALHGVTADQMREAHRILEVGAAGLAAERATGEDLAVMAEELAAMFAALDEPDVFLRHELRFHGAVAAASGNPMAAAYIRTLAEVLEDHGPPGVRDPGLRNSAETHRRLYRAIRGRNPERARSEMDEHYAQARGRRGGSGVSGSEQTGGPPRALGRIA